METIVTILGCGSSGGVPLVGGADGAGYWGVCNPANPKNQRSRASVLVETAGVRLLIDTSPDLRHQLLANRIGSIDAILYTHEHADHLHGIDDIRSLNFQKNAALPCYGDARTLAAIEQRFPYIFTPLKPGSGFYKPSLIPHPIVPPQPFVVQGVTVQPFWQSHGGVRSVGYRIGAIAYSPDVMAFPAESEPFLSGLSLWIVDCVQEEPHPTHAHLDLTLSWIARYRPARAVLTHLNHTLDYEAVTARLPGDSIQVAWDGMRVSVAAESMPAPHTTAHRGF